MTSAMAALWCAAVFLIAYALDCLLLGWQCLSRPVVAAPLVGLVLGDVMTGLLTGGLLEAVFLGVSAVGGSVPSDSLSASVLAVLLARVLPIPDAALVGVALGLFLGMPVSVVRSWLARRLCAIAPFWAELAGSCRPARFVATNVVVGLLWAVPLALVVLAEGLALGLVCDHVVGAAPAWALRGLVVAGSLMPLVGIGTHLAQTLTRWVAAFLAMGLVLAWSAGLSGVDVAVIAGAAAASYVVAVVEAAPSRGRSGSVESRSAEEASDDLEDFFS